MPVPPPNRTVRADRPVPLYGLDIDQNYRGPRLAVGFNWAKWEVELLYAYFEYMRNGGNRISGGGFAAGRVTAPASEGGTAVATQVPEGGRRVIFGLIVILVTAGYVRISGERQQA